MVFFKVFAVLLGEFDFASCGRFHEIFGEFIFLEASVLESFGDVVVIRVDELAFVDEGDGRQHAFGLKSGRGCKDLQQQFADVLLKTIALQVLYCYALVNYHPEVVDLPRTLASVPVHHDVGVRKRRVDAQQNGRVRLLLELGPVLEPGGRSLGQFTEGLAMVGE